MLIHHLAHAGLECGTRILIVDGDQRCPVHPGMRDAVYHVCGPRPSGRHTNTWRACYLAPGRCQHGPRGFLFHQDEADLAIARRFHQLNRLSTGVADDKRRSHLIERLAEDFYGRGHCRIPFLYRWVDIDDEI